MSDHARTPPRTTLGVAATIGTVDALRAWVERAERIGTITHRIDVDLVRQSVSDIDRLNTEYASANAATVAALSMATDRADERDTALRLLRDIRELAGYAAHSADRIEAIAKRIDQSGLPIAPTPSQETP